MSSSEVPGTEQNAIVGDVVDVKQAEPRQPKIADLVHYVSHGTPVRADGTQAFESVCRAAVVAEVHDMEPVPEHGIPYVTLCVLNPTGLLFHKAAYDAGQGNPGDLDCDNAPYHGQPFRYCGACRYSEPALIGGTWHWTGHE